MKIKNEEGKFAKCKQCGSKQFELVKQGDVFRGVYCKECGKFMGWVDKRKAGVFKSHNDYKEFD